MDDPLERQLTRLHGRDAAAPPALRDAVLAAMRRELRAQRWDRRLGRVAACLLIGGVGLNIAAGLASERFAPTNQRLASSDSLVQTAVAVAQATDPETGRLLAQQLAAWQGRAVTPQQLAAIDAALDAASPGSPL
jgi:hypothetical protein